MGNWRKVSLQGQAKIVVSEVIREFGQVKAVFFHAFMWVIFPWEVR